MIRCRGYFTVVFWNSFWRVSVYLLLPNSYGTLNHATVMIILMQYFRRIQLFSINQNIGFLPQNLKFLFREMEIKRDFTEPTVTWTFKIITWEGSDLDSSHCITQKKFTRSRIKPEWLSKLHAKHLIKFCFDRTFLFFLWQWMPFPKRSRN